MLFFLLFVGRIKENELYNGEDRHDNDWPDYMINYIVREIALSDDFVPEKVKKWPDDKPSDDIADEADKEEPDGFLGGKN